MGTFLGGRGVNVSTLGSEEGTIQNSVGTQEHLCRHTGPGSTATRGGVQRGLPNSTFPVHPTAFHTATKFRCHFTSDSSNPPTLQPQLCLSQGYEALLRTPSSLASLL